jgi:hypothetical protein
MHIVIRTALFLLLPISLSSCKHSSNPSASLTISPEKDNDYLKILEKYTFKKNIYRNFETKFTVSVSMLTGELRRAIASRHEEIMGAGQNNLAEFSNQTGFFVSLYSPSSENQDLDDTNFWDISLNKNGETYKPVVVKSLTPKKKWQLFFPDVTNWSKEYLLVFDVPTTIGSDHKMLATEKLSLSLNNVDAKLTIQY